MKPNYLLSLGLLMLISVSCTKEMPLSQPDLELSTKAISSTNNGKKTKLIKREVRFNVFRAELMAIKRVREFSYDALNRVTKVVEGRIDSGVVNPTFKLSTTYAFQYNGSSQLPHSMSIVRSALSNIERFFYFTYNEAGEKIMDSVSVTNVQGEGGYIKVHYEYDKKNIYATPFRKAFSLDFSPYDTLEMKNHNIEKLITKRFNKDVPSTSVNYFTYDKNPNPFSKLNVSNALYFVNSSMGTGYNTAFTEHYSGINRNNVLSYGNPPTAVNYRYVYDADGYPLMQETSYGTDNTMLFVTYLQY